MDLTVPGCPWLAYGIGLAISRELVQDTTQRNLEIKMAAQKKTKKKKAKNSLESEPKRPDRDAKGRLLPGHSQPGPGRPKGSIDFMATVRKLAKDEGQDLPRLVWEMSKAMIANAMDGDQQSAKLMLDRLCGTEKEAATLAVQVNNLSAGPPVPATHHLGEFLQKLNEVATPLLDCHGDDHTKNNVEVSGSTNGSTNGKAQ